MVCLFVRIFRPVLWPSWVKSIELSGYWLHGIVLCWLLLPRGKSLPPSPPPFIMSSRFHLLWELSPLLTLFVEFLKWSTVANKSRSAGANSENTFWSTCGMMCLCSLKDHRRVRSIGSFFIYPLRRYISLNLVHFGAVTCVQMVPRKLAALSISDLLKECGVGWNEVMKSRGEMIIST